MLIRPSQTIVFLGDSITEDPNGYVGIVQEMLDANLPGHGVTILNAGRGGDKASDLHARLQAEVMDKNPNWVAVSCGVNDVWHGFFDFERNEPRAEFDPHAGLALDPFKRHLHAIVSEIGNKGASALLLSPTVIGEDPKTRENQLLASYVSAVKEIAEQRGALYCPMHERFWEAIEAAQEEEPPESLTTDGVHMTEQGAWAMAQIVLDAIGFFESLEQ